MCFAGGYFSQYSCDWLKFVIGSDQWNIANTEKCRSAFASSCFINPLRMYEQICVSRDQQINARIFWILDLLWKASVCLWLRFGSVASGWSSDISEALSLGFGGNWMLKRVIIHEDE